jgi:hypothetical protein
MRLSIFNFVVILSMTCFASFLQAQALEGYTWQAKHSVNFGEGANHFSIKAASSGSGGEVELRLDAVDGPVIGRVYFNHTGNSYLYPDSSVHFLDYECKLAQTVSGTHDVYMNFQDYTKPALGGVLNIGAFKFDLVEASSVISQERLHVYPSVPGLDPSPYYEFRVQKVNELNSANLADVTNWETPFAWFTNSPLKGTAAGYDYASYIGGWSQTYTNFELDPNTPIVVKITRKTVTGDDAPFGPINSAAVHPAHMVDSYQLINGEVYITMSKPAQVTVDIDGQLDTRNAPRYRDGWDSGAFPYTSKKLGCHAVTIFANPFIDDKPDPNAAGVLVIKAGQQIPADINTRTWTTLYFEPGVHKLSVDVDGQGKLVERRWKKEDVIQLKSNRTIYIPGDAIVYGNFNDFNRSTSTTENIRIYGHGTLSGSKILFWKAWPVAEFPPLGEYPYSDWHRAILVRNAKNVRYEGITAVDPANHTFTLGGNLNTVYQPNIIKGCKVIAWRPNSDATAIDGHTILEDCFLRTQDDGHYIGGAVTMRRVVFWHDVNGQTFRGSATTRRYGADNASNIPTVILVEDIDIIYARGVFGFGTNMDYSIFGGGEGDNKILKDGVENTGQMVHFRNIRITDPKPLRHMFGFLAEAGKAGNLAGIRLENVVYSAKQTFNWKDGAFLGTPTRAFSNFVFDNVSVNGQKFDQNYLKNTARINSNAYLYDMTFRINTKIPSTEYTLITTATNGAIEVNTETGTPGIVTVTAVPKNGYRFGSWSGDLSGTDPIATISMEGDKGITANFDLITYSISQTAENGTITLEPALDKYLPGTVVTAKAVGNLGYGFTSWGGDLSGSVNPITITMDGDKNISATFGTVPTYTLSATAANGSIVLNPPGGVYNEGTTVKVSHSADFGYLFSGWSGDLSGSADSTTVTMDANKSITASFDFVGGAIESFAVNCGGPAYTATDGTLFSADKFYTGGNTYSTTSAISGTEDDILYQTERWGDVAYNIALPNGIYDITLLFAEIYQTQPAQRVFNVSVEGKPIISNLDIWSEAGANAAYDVTFTVMLVDGELNILLQKIADNAKISAIKVNPAFNGLAYKLESQATNGSIVVSPAGTNFMAGTEVTLTAVPNPGFKFDNWTGDASGEINPTKITLDADKSVIANFSVYTGTGSLKADTPTARLMQNYPNPFSTKTTITYQIDEATDVELSIYDIFGRKVAVLVKEHQAAGEYSIDWLLMDGQLSNGLFLYQLKTDNHAVQIKKASLQK